MPFSSSTCKTPMCAKPRAAPPPSASPMRGGLGTGTGTTATGGSVAAGGCPGGVWQAASITSRRPAAQRRSGRIGKPGDTVKGSSNDMGADSIDGPGFGCFQITIIDNQQTKL
jgi:hypothetical protein